jgi:maleate isomerase
MVEKRVGLLLPAANVTVEAEAAHLGNVHFQRFDPAAGKEGIVEAGRMLAATKPARIGVAYATGSYLEPRAFDDELLHELEDATGAEAVTAARAMVDRLRRMEARRIGVVSPYSDSVNAACSAYLVANGFEVAALVGEPPQGGAGSVTPEEVRALVLSVSRDGVDAIAISCTGLRTLAALPGLRQACGLPVTSTNEALLEALTA